MNNTPASGRVRWDVDDRRATLFTRLYVRGMFLARDKKAFEGEQHTLLRARTQQRSGNHGPTVVTRLMRRVSEVWTGAMRSWVIRPWRRAPVVRIIYLHGGGYVHPLTPDYWRLVRSLGRIPAEVVVPAYPLAPDATVDEVLPLLLAVERETSSAVPTILMGDSAGGALALVLARKLRGRSDSPIGVVALCPWLDATLTEESITDLESTDPMLAPSGLRAAGRWWAGPRSPADPLVSPLVEDLHGLPPIDVYIGDRDILRPAVDDLAERARQEGAPLHVHESTAMFHVWMTRMIPEGHRTRRELQQAVQRRAATAGTNT